MNLSEFIIWTYLRVEEIYVELVGFSRLRQRGPDPGLSDVEVITMEIIGEYQGARSDSALWRYFDEHWRSWFPKLGSRQNFAKHCAKLWAVKSQIQKRLFAPRGEVFMIDGAPLPICHYARAKRCKSLAGEAAYGYCAAKREHYYGLRAHVVIDLRGRVCAFRATPANLDEREAARGFFDQINGFMIADKGYIGAEFQAQAVEKGVIFQTPWRKNMNDPRDKHFLRQLIRVRRKIESVIAQLTEHFNLTTIKARIPWRFENRLTRKILAFNFAVEFAGSTQLRKT